MSTAESTLLQSVLALPEERRLVFLEALLASLPDDVLDADTAEMDDDAFLDELNRRSEEFKQDPSVGVPWSELKLQR